MHAIIVTHHDGSSATSTGVDEIHVVGRDGSGLTRLTHGMDAVR